MRLRTVRRKAAWILLGFVGAFLLVIFMAARTRPYSYDDHSNAFSQETRIGR